MQTVTDALVLRERKLDEHGPPADAAFRRPGDHNRLRQGSGTHEGLDGWCHRAALLFPLCAVPEPGAVLCRQGGGQYAVFRHPGDLEKLTLATYFAQLCCELIPENEPAVEELRLMLNTLYCLERDKLPPLQLKAILELRLLTLTGYMPDLIACRACGGLPEDGVVLFDPSGGSICCPGCAPSGAVGLLPLPPGVFAAMRHIIYCDFEKLFQFKLGEENLPVLAHAVEQYLLCQVERILPALNFYKTICI